MYHHQAEPTGLPPPPPSQLAWLWTYKFANPALIKAMEGSSKGFTPAAPRTNGQTFSCKSQDQGHSCPCRLGPCGMTVPLGRWHERLPPSIGVHPTYLAILPSWAEKGAKEAEKEGQPHGCFQNPGGEELGLTDAHFQASVQGGPEDWVSITAKGEGG